ncbi:Tn7 transposase TnsA N-terminal domain-containing protein [Planctobacterium marinum]|uniref:Tn7 transposase TnsA N-terminal domain-containing protein n=1 Tax=Planctobacterium marinum TaxID=1631968 RepID=UPI003CC810AE
MKKRSLTKSTCKNIHKFASSKNDSTVIVESGLEFDACFHFEFSNNVKFFESQPLGFEYYYLNKWRRYTPDFLVHFTDNTKRYFEVKPLNKTLSPEFQSKFNAIQRQSNEIQLELITEPVIRKLPLIQNLKLLHKYSELEPNTMIMEKIRWLKPGEKVSIMHISRTLCMELYTIIPHILKLVGMHQFNIEMSKPFSGESKIWRLL